MADRLADQLAIAQVATAAITAQRRVLHRRVAIGDHLAMTALMTGLATGLAARPPRLGRLGACGGSLDGGRELFVEF